MGEGKPNTICISKGNGQSLLWTSQTGGDDQLTFNGITTGANGICETTKTDARDLQVIPMGKGEPFAVIVTPGADGLLNTAVNGSGVKNVAKDENGNIIEVIDDDTVVGETITTGADGIRETPHVVPAQAPLNVPTKAQLQEKMDRIFGKQANIYFDVKFVNHVDVSYDVGDQNNELPGADYLKHPNGKFDHFISGEDLSPEEKIIEATAHDATADFNLYYFGSRILGTIKLELSDGSTFYKGLEHVGFARTDTKTPFVQAYDPNEIDPQKQFSAPVLAAIGAHELAHNDFFKRDTGLDHPRQDEIVNGQVTYVIEDAVNGFTLKKEADDKKRLMWARVQEGVEFPEMLLKDECDRLHGLKTKE